MKIFEKRPLALILCIMLGGFSFFVDFDWKIRIAIILVSLISIGLFFIFDNLKRCRNVLTILCICAFSASIILSVLWSFLFFPSKLYGESSEIKARVYDIDNTDSVTSTIICKAEEINGEKASYTFIAYVDKSDAVRIRKYDVITFTAEINEFKSYDDGFDGRTYYVSKGYSAYLFDLNNISILDNRPDVFDRLFDSLQLKISNTLKLRTNFETGAFLSALIVGDRSDLSGNTKLNFARLGISHILALSGMHLAILSIALNVLLTRLRINKKIRMAIIIPIILFYMALTGFTSSVLRSGIMLIISCILYLLSKKADPLTSLTISVFIIVLFDPASVFDMSLWLSAFATLGVVVFSEIAKKPDKDSTRPIRLWIAFKNGCLVSVFAFVATFAFTALRFNAFSVASVFTTLLFSFLIQFFIYAGLLLIVIGGIIPFGRVVVIFSDVILWIAEKLSMIKFIYVSMNSIVVKMLIVLICVYFFSLLVLEIKNKKRGVLILIALLLIVFTYAEIDTILNIVDDEVIYVPSESGDVTLLKSNSEVTAIYSGKAFMDNAWDILDAFSDEGLTYLDNFVLVNYSYSVIDFTKSIIDGIKIEKIFLPTPVTDEELNRAEGISDLTSRYGTCIEFYNLYQSISFGEYEYRLFDKVDYIYGKYPANVYEITVEEEHYTYLSVCEYDILSPSAKALLYNSENLIIGSIGNTNYYLFDMKLPKIKNILYYDSGRLTDEAVEYYKEKGASVHCTQTPIDIYD